LERTGQIKYPFSIRILEERLSLEQKWLVIFNNSKGTDFGDANIQSCEHRIEELKNSIENLKLIIT